MHDAAPSRRQVLASGFAVGLAAASGCLGLTDDVGSGLSDDGSERSLVLSLHREDGPLRDGFVSDLSENRVEGDEAAFDAALNGSDYTIQYRKPFLSTPEDPVYARRNDTYYRLGSVVVDEATATRPVVRLFAVEADAPSGAVPASDLPAVDRTAVQRAYFVARARGNAGGVPWAGVDRGGYAYRSGEAVDASRLLDDDGPDIVTYRDDAYRVEVTRETFREPVYRPTAEPVADEPERLERILRARFVDAYLPGESLSEGARDLLRTARVEGYRETHPYSAAYEEVLRALHARAYLDGNVENDAAVADRGRSMLRYDGAYYDYRLRFEAGADGS